MKPTISYYARFKDVTGSGKSLKYKVTMEVGNYPPMEALKGRDGETIFFLLESMKSGSISDNAPAMRLQGKNSLNVTGLKGYFINGKISGHAYGYPPSTETYSKKNLVNPFYDYRTDGFLFKFHWEDDANGGLKPDSFEMMVLTEGKVLIPTYCKQLVMGGFNDDLEALRKSVTNAISL